MQLKDNQKVNISTVLLSEAGNPTQITNLSVQSSDTSVCTVADNGDGTATVVATGKLGNCQIIVKGTADDGTEVGGTQDIEVVASSGRILEINADVPIDI